jgi:hypothetical protein
MSLYCLDRSHSSFVHQSVSLGRKVGKVIVAKGLIPLMSLLERGESIYKLRVDFT